MSPKLQTTTQISARNANVVIPRSKLVFQPLFNLANCNAGRYQPIVFTTHGNSECIYSKSKCTEEGQVVVSNDSLSSDAACRCDYTKGYAFVTKPKNSCFCKPSEEDCSCFIVTCTKLSPDYQCITDKEMVVNATCQEILPLISYDTDNNTAQFIGSNIKSHSNSHRVADIISASITVSFVLAVIVLLKFVVFGKHFLFCDYKYAQLTEEKRVN
ncbi:unnamed protein product [Mytilus coruscus]|uniref:Uncharacterized protein n=1 Tax=Mytilus coruscus TaxID=42192 RepID=A0A6J8DUB8_MYTCO|nr:unnamed protein product [Mytilus coruscus]